MPTCRATVGDTGQNKDTGMALTPYPDESKTRSRSRQEEGGLGRIQEVQQKR